MQLSRYGCLPIPEKTYAAFTLWGIPIPEKTYVALMLWVHPNTRKNVCSSHVMGASQYPKKRMQLSRYGCVPTLKKTYAASQYVLLSFTFLLLLSGCNGGGARMPFCALGPALCMESRGIVAEQRLSTPCQPEPSLAQAVLRSH